MRACAAGALLLAVVIVQVTACGGTPRRTASPTSSISPPRQRPTTQEGLATWYGGRRWHGRKTASGERFNENAFTAAHLKLPFGTRVRVTNKKNGRSVEVRINDRGPYGGHGHIIDLSKAAARSIGMISDGIVPVRLEVLWTP